MDSGSSDLEAHSFAGDGNERGVVKSDCWLLFFGDGSVGGRKIRGEQKRDAGRTMENLGEKEIIYSKRKWVKEIWENG
ncbi:hypothetical protein H5410_025530 [Solanum commersonii]|uniref:Uncharacterized protein n=1 Tax=Solanum commersonii TaxID=4109 RepID=A0A9J5YYS6_SOLCO|nr:hypothetical protein H5410_025530 [Solanum commersonii]